MFLQKKLLVLFLAISLIFASSVKVSAQQASESGSVGLQGTVSAPAPKLAPLISIPSNGNSFSKLPVTVSGFCDSDLLVKVFKNGVFGGSAQCQSGSFTMQIDIFSGRNDLVAKQYDLLDQESPASATVTVTYDDNGPASTAAERVTLTSNFAKRGANPGEKIFWPIAVSGGAGPYAVTVKWGDGEESLYSISTPSEFTIDHSYQNPGSYTVVVKAVDSQGRTAYLQVVAIGNGPLSQEGTSGSTSTTSGGTDATNSDGTPKTRILWQPAAIMIPFIVSTFWLGRRYAVYRIRKKIEQGERPFSY